MNKNQIIAVAAVVMLLAVAVGVPMAAHEEESEAVLLVVALAIPIVVTPIIFFIAGYFYGKGASAPDTTALRAAETITTTLGISGPWSEFVSQLMPMTNSLRDRTAEIAASEIWAAGKTLDPDDILVRSGTLADSACGAVTAASAISERIKATSQISAEYKVGGSSMSAGSARAISYGLGVNVTSEMADRVYIYTEREGDQISGTIDVRGGAATLRAPGKTYALSEGRNDLKALGIPSGMYELQAGRSYVGSLYPSKAADAATVLPAICLKGATGTMHILKSGSTVSAVGGASGDKVEIKFSHAGESATADLTPGMDIMAQYLTGSMAVVNHAVGAAQAVWEVFNTAGKASIWASPSMLMPNLDNMSFTPTQSYLIYMASLQQMCEYYKTARDNFTPENVKISEDSLDLVCYGTIRSATNDILANNTIFTPVCYLRDQAVTVGSTLWGQAGLAMVYEQAPGGKLSSKGIIPLESGSKFTLTKIVYKGTVYDQPGQGVTLHIHKLTTIQGWRGGDIDPVPPKKTDWLQIAVIALGLLTLVAGALTRRVDLLLGGLILIACGIIIVPYISPMIGLGK